MAPTLELRKGAQVLYRSPLEDGWQTGELVHASATGEEWLVKNRLGKFWLSLDRIRLGDEETTY